MGAHFVGIDVGTQSTKVLLVDGERGCVVARAARGHVSLQDPASGRFEQDPAVWLAALRGACQELSATHPREWRSVQAVGVSGQQHGLVVLDEQGEVLRPAKLWCDTSTQAEAEELSQALGRRIPVGFTASKLLWLLRREPEHAARVRRVLLPHDYINWVLSGKAWMECGDSSGTGFFDSDARRFDARALARIDARLEDWLPPLVEARSLPARLDARGCELTGLFEGTAIAAGSGDNMCSALGAGAVCEGLAVLSLGTSATIFAHSARPVHDPRGWIAPFCDAAGAWLPLACVMNATAAQEEWTRLFGGSRAEFEAAALRAPLGAGGLCILPYLIGERVPDLPHARASLHGWRSGALTRENLARAILEGVAHSLRLCLEQFTALGLAAEELRVVGGAASSPAWQRVLADVLQVPLSIGAESETAALGAALQAQWAHAGVASSSCGAPLPTLSTLVEPHLAHAARVEPDRTLGAQAADAQAQHRQRLALLHGVRT